MGIMLGKITVETPKYQLLSKHQGFEVRSYSPCVIAEVSYDPATMKRGRDGGFMILAEYIGALGTPKNEKSEQGSPEKIAMTAPVITTERNNKSEKIDMTAPVITQESSTSQGSGKLVTMQFVLPSKYTSMEGVPRPKDSRVNVKPVEAKKYGVITFSGVADDKQVKEKLEELTKGLQQAGYKVTGDYMLARYNPPWTPWFLRTNEVMLPVD